MKGHPRLRCGAANSEPDSSKKQQRAQCAHLPSIASLRCDGVLRTTRPAAYASCIAKKTEGLRPAAPGGGSASLARPCCRPCDPCAPNVVRSFRGFGFRSASGVFDLAWPMGPPLRRLSAVRSVGAARSGQDRPPGRGPGWLLGRHLPRAMRPQLKLGQQSCQWASCDRLTVPLTTSPPSREAGKRGPTGRDPGSFV